MCASVEYLAQGEASKAPPLLKLENLIKSPFVFMHTSWSLQTFLSLRSCSISELRGKSRQALLRVLSEYCKI
jgi:hypothetical protein